MNNDTQNAQMFKALSDENRLCILRLLQNRKQCACVLLEQLSISQSTLSHHMKILVESGLVTCSKEGKWTHYAIAAPGVVQLQTLISTLFMLKQENVETEELCC